MEIAKAEKIITEYEKCLARGTVGETMLRPDSWLKSSQALIKFAIYTEIEHLMSADKLSDSQKDHLTGIYAELESFVPDREAERYASLLDQWQKKKHDLGKGRSDENLIKQYINYTARLKFLSDNSRLEIFSFIRDIEKLASS